MKYLPIIIAAYCFLLPAYGQEEVARVAEAYLSSNHLIPGEQAILWVNVQGGKPDGRPQAPEVEGVAINFAQAITRMDINRKLTQVYAYRISAPNPGKYIIPSVEMTSGGKSLLTSPISFHVHPISSLKQIPTGINATTIKVGWFSDKTTLYQGEVCPVTLKVYSPSRLRAASFGLPDPKKENCLAWRFSIPDRRLTSSTTLNGETHQIIRYDTTLSGIAPGKAVLGPAKLSLFVRQRVIDPRRGSVLTETPLNLALPSLELNILPLPSGAPAHFNGAVGNFQVSAECEKVDLKNNDSTEVTLHIDGSGNLMSIKPPTLDRDTWKVIDTSKVTRGRERRYTTGRVTFKQLIRPQINSSHITEHSTFNIPSYSFSFFDPTDKKYHTLKTPPIPVNITPVAQSTVTNTTLSTPDNNTPPEEMQDILGFIDTPYLQITNYKSRITNYWHLVPATLALLIIGIALRKRHRRNLRLNPDAAEQKIALNKLNEATDTRTFYRRAGRIIDRWLKDGAEQPQLQEIITERDTLCFQPKDSPTEEISPERKRSIIDLLKRSTKLTVIFLLFLAAQSPIALDAQDKNSPLTIQHSPSNSARDAWKTKDYQQALNIYQNQYPDPNKTPADILYNIGNCHHRLDQHGLATLAWRRALLADPTHQRARKNLRFTEISQKANVPAQLPWQRYLAITGSNTYFVILYACGWVIALATLSMFLFLRSKTILTITIITICLSAAITCAAGFAIIYHPDGHYQLAPPEEQAVIITETPLFKEAQRSSGNSTLNTQHSTLKLTPASLVKVIALRGPWTHIATAEKEEGWVETKHLSKLIQDNHE